MSGRIVAGLLAPHPPHLVYAENPPQNEPRAECGWETLRWGYHRMRDDLAAREVDALVVLSPHWQTYVGTHFLGVERFQGLSVDPIFPHLFRYQYDLTVDVGLARAIHDAAGDRGLAVKMMENPDFRVDYGTIVSCHMSRPAWDLPVVAISSNRSTSYYSAEVMQEKALALAEATREAVAASGKRVALLASNSLSHRHFTTEPTPPEDQSHEHVYSHGQYLWDMKVVEMLRAGRAREAFDCLPEFIDQAVSEADAGSFAWLLAGLGFPTHPAEVYAYGTVIGTGNAVAAWWMDEEGEGAS